MLFINGNEILGGLLVIVNVDAVKAAILKEKLFGLIKHLQLPMITG